MRMEDMILVSIDDHTVEPPDMYDHHLPAKYTRSGPEDRPRRPGHRSVGVPGAGHVHTVRDGGHRRLAARGVGFQSGRFSELRPGCFDVHERVRDMNVNGVLASMCFPTMAGFNARTFTEAARQGTVARDAPGLQRLAHRRVVRRLPGPVHPAGDRPDVGRRPGCEGGAAARRTRDAGPSASWRPHTRRDGRASSRGTGTRCSRPSSMRTWCSACTSAVRPAHTAGTGGARSTTDRRPDPGHDAGRPGPALRPDLPQVPRPAGRPSGGRDRLDPLLPRAG